MKVPQNLKLANTALIGICFAVIILLLVIAYIPSFAPNAYEHLRQTGIITVVPLVASVGGFSALAWLWMISGAKENNSERGNY